jgi:hypothetical protein
MVQFNVRKKPEAMRVLGFIHPLNIDLQPAEPGVPFNPLPRMLLSPKGRAYEWIKNPQV